ncbi:antitoxin Xre/MbcA/ParS toxin-binding domain-containing protein [Pseudomonas rossensis]|uniref:antitoxin Xre/MbcA/ParS toxin-binding domain-containing protein n=1 Tax=Pseudomonas rossensis TaxID=2305471 RepID=UPI0032611B59
MSENERWIVKCQGTEDGSGDVIVDLPPQLLAQMGLGVGDDLTITVTNGAIVLKPAHATTSVRPDAAGVLRDDAYHAYRLRVEASLQIPSIASDQVIHNMIEAGFSASLVKSLCDVGTISSAERDRIIPLKALKTKLLSNQLLTVNESDRLFRVVHISAMAEVIFGDAAKAKHWLSTPKSRFSGKSPNEMLSTTPGTHQVEEMLIQVAEGMSF